MKIIIGGKVDGLFFIIMGYRWILVMRVFDFVVWEFELLFLEY